MRKSGFVAEFARLSFAAILLIAPMEAQAVNAALVQDASTSSDFTTGYSVTTTDMSNYKDKESNGSILSNYVGNVTWSGSYTNWVNQAALKFTLPATASVLSTAKLHLPVIDIQGSAKATATLTDDNAWQQADDWSTSTYPSLLNEVVLLSDYTVASTGDVSLSLATANLDTKIVPGGTTTVTLVLTGNSATDNYFNFVADDDASSDQAYLVLTFKPQVQSVTVPANNTYLAGDVLSFTVSFDSLVNVTGTPKLSLILNTGGTVQASYVSGSGSQNLVFRYTVSSGNVDADGVTVGALALSGGTIRSDNEDDAELTLYSVGATTGVKVDAVVPTLSNVAPPTAGTYASGQNLDYTVSFSEAVDVVTTGGTPYLTLTVGGSTVHAAYLSGSTTSAIKFRYTVASGDLDADGVALASNVTLNGGTIKDAAGNNATLTFTGGTAASVLVDGRSSQTITFTAPGSKDFGTTPTLLATSTSGLAVTFTSSTTGVCTITSGGVLAFLTPGICTIDADQAGNAAYQAAPTVSRSFSVVAVVPGAPTIGTATAGNGQAVVSFTAPVGNGGAAITGYTVTSSPGGKTGTGASSPITVTGLTNGTAYTFTVTATNGAGAGAASSASNGVTPIAPQTITFGDPGSKDFGTTPTLSATASSGLAVSFTSSTTSVCTITSGGVLAFLTPGMCTIDADQAGNAAYQAAATVSRSFSVVAVVPGAPTIGTATAGNGQAVVSFTAPVGNGGAAITSYTVTSSPGGKTGTGASSPITVTGLTNGTAYTFTVTATNGAGTGAASSASNSVTPIASQTITFTAPVDQDYGNALTLSATVSSGLAVNFTSSTPGVCTITSGGVLAFLTPGTCTISADQAGNAAYQAAATVSRSFLVRPRPVLVTALPRVKVIGAADPVLAYTSSGLLAGDAFTGSLARAAGEAVGTYPIGQGTLSAGSNYAISFTGADLVIQASTALASRPTRTPLSGELDAGVAKAFSSVADVPGPGRMEPAACRQDVSCLAVDVLLTGSGKVDVAIFDNLGVPVMAFEKVVSRSDLRRLASTGDGRWSLPVSWNLRTSRGDAVPSGVYLWRISVRTDDGQKLDIVRRLGVRNR